jgi:hypothetical protein
MLGEGEGANEEVRPRDDYVKRVDDETRKEENLS